MRLGGVGGISLRTSNELVRPNALAQHTNLVSGDNRQSMILSLVELPKLVANLKCQRFLDVGCGDWNWMRNVDLPCEYIGIDIVPEIIAANRRGERAGISFDVVDSIVGPLPEADIALCREILFHLSFRDARATLANVRKAASWLIATTDTSIWFNSDIPTGDFRKINLQRHPYRFPKPQQIIIDDAVSKGRVLGLWKTADLPV